MARYKMRGSMIGRRRGGQISGRMSTPAQQRARRQNIKKAQMARRSDWF